MMRCWLIQVIGIGEGTAKWLALKDEETGDSEGRVIRLQPHKAFVADPNEAVKFSDEDSARLTMQALYRGRKERESMMAVEHTFG